MVSLLTQSLRGNTLKTWILDFKDKKLSLARAGHNLPLHFDATTGRITRLNPNGLGIGMVKNGVFSRLMEEMTIPLGAGDVLLFYTDGVTEAMNRSDQEFGCGRLEEVLRQTAHLGAEDIKEQVLSNLTAFTRGVPFADDVTLVVTKVRG